LLVLAVLGCNKDNSNINIEYPVQGEYAPNLLSMADGTELVYNEEGNYCIAANLDGNASLRVRMEILSRECEVNENTWEVNVLGPFISLESTNDMVDVTSNGHSFDQYVDFSNYGYGTFRIQIWENNSATPITKTMSWKPITLSAAYHTITYGLLFEPSLLDLQNNYASLNTTDEYPLILEPNTCATVYALFKNVGDSANTWLTLSNLYDWDIEYIKNDIKITPLSDDVILNVRIKPSAGDSLRIECFENNAAAPARVLSYKIVK